MRRIEYFLPNHRHRETRELINIVRLHGQSIGKVILRAVIQRVSSAKVTTEGEILATIGRGMVILLGVAQDDQKKDADYLTEKITNLRIFNDAAGKMNLSIRDMQGDILLVSQFTLLADCRKGRRPSFIEAARPDQANELYQYFFNKIKESGLSVREGRFQAIMSLELVNDGPVTLLLDSAKEL